MQCHPLIILSKALMDAIEKGSSSPPPAPTDSTASPKDTQDVPSPVPLRKYEADTLSIESGFMGSTLSLAASICSKCGRSFDTFPTIMKEDSAMTEKGMLLASESATSGEPSTPVHPTTDGEKSIAVAGRTTHPYVSFGPGELIPTLRRITNLEASHEDQERKFMKLIVIKEAKVTNLEMKLEKHEQETESKLSELNEKFDLILTRYRKEEEMSKKEIYHLKYKLKEAEEEIKKYQKEEGMLKQEVYYHQEQENELQRKYQNEEEMLKQELKWQKAKDVHKKYLWVLLEYPDVTAVDIGYRKKKGVVEREGEIYLLIWVRKIASLKEGALPTDFEGVPVALLEGEAKYTVRQQPLRGGDCLAPYKAKSHGTLGYFARDRSKDANVGVVSAGHVMRAHGEKRLLVPSTLTVYDDTGNDHHLHDQVANVVKTYVGESNVDCGFAVLTLDTDVQGYTLSNKESVQRVATCDDIFLKRDVFFCGCTSQETSAVIESNIHACKINYGNEVHRYTNQLRLSEKSQGGDSGSLVVERENKIAVGLLFADLGGEGVANPIHEVESALEVDLMTLNAD